jgi:hypothetical protein
MNWYKFDLIYISFRKRPVSETVTVWVSSSNILHANLVIRLRYENYKILEVTPMIIELNYVVGLGRQLALDNPKYKCKHIIFTI